MTFVLCCGGWAVGIYFWWRWLGAQAKADAADRVLEERIAAYCADRRGWREVEQTLKWDAEQLLKRARQAETERDGLVVLMGSALDRVGFEVRRKPPTPDGGGPAGE